MVNIRNTFTKFEVNQGTDKKAIKKLRKNVICTACAFINIKFS